MNFDPRTCTSARRSKVVCFVKMCSLVNKFAWRLCDGRPATFCRALQLTTTCTRSASSPALLVRRPVSLSHAYGHVARLSLLSQQRCLLCTSPSRWNTADTSQVSQYMYSYVTILEKTRHLPQFQVFGMGQKCIHCWLLWYFVWLSCSVLWRITDCQ